MLEEQSQFASNYSEENLVGFRPVRVDPHQKTMNTLHDAIAGVMQIEQEGSAPSGMQQVVAQFRGHLLIPPAEALEQLEPTFEQLGVHAYLTHDENSDRQLFTVLRGRFKSQPRQVWVNILMVGLTFLSLMFVASNGGYLWEGLPYAISIMLILGAHELGHYFAARYHRVNVTLPYFIPMPITLFGTFGAFIQLREPMKNKRVLFDVGIAGPLAGLIFAVPILFIGLATSQVGPTPDVTYIQEGNSIFYAVAKLITFGEFLPSGGQDVSINQLAWAGWTGLFITGLNLIPLGQLDGGHVSYSLFGRQIKGLYMPLLMGFLLLTFLNFAWFPLVILLFFLGRVHATPLDDITPLDTRRRLLGYFILVVFILIFVPNPIEFINA